MGRHIDDLDVRTVVDLAIRFHANSTSETGEPSPS
jgi:hypothetical protein